MPGPMVEEWNIQEKVYFLLICLPLNLFEDTLVLFSFNYGKIALFVAVDCCCSRCLIDQSKFAERLACGERYNFDEPLDVVQLTEILQF